MVLKVTKWVEWESYVDVSISTEDIATALMAEADKPTALLMGMNGVAAFMKAVPDGVISELTEAQREIVFKLLHEQSQRFAPKEVAK